jgi:amino acid efflux transporter
VLAYGALNTYIAGASRLGAALAEQRLLPHRMASPHRGLLMLGAAIAVLAAATLLLPIGLDPLLRATSACLAAVMLVGTLAAIRLLPAGWMRAVSVAGSALTASTLLLSGVYLIVPTVIAVAGFSAKAAHSMRSGHHPSRDGAAAEQHTFDAQGAVPKPATTAQ